MNDHYRKLGTWTYGKIIGEGGDHFFLLKFLKMVSDK